MTGIEALAEKVTNGVFTIIRSRIFMNHIPYCGGIFRSRRSLEKYNRSLDKGSNDSYYTKQNLQVTANSVWFGDALGIQVKEDI